MTVLLVVMVTGLVAIVAATLVGRRLGIASPLVLVALGVAASFLPVVGAIEIRPEWVLAGVLPPLLYSAAVSMPAMNFRREFGAISGLSVILVVASALLLGLFFMIVFPGLGFAWGVALGAVISPTDAVATSIVKQTSVSRRVVAMLDGESLLNDATALVLLRTAIAVPAAAAATFSVWAAIGTFVYSVIAAVVIGLAAGWLNLIIRRRVSDATVNTVISFTVPFLASVPAELLESSGLVAAVVAGLVTGVRAPRDLSAQTRLSDSQNWRTVELVLEGAVFLTMGLQLRTIVISVERDHAGVGTAVLVAVGALLLTIIIRAAYVAPLLAFLRSMSGRGAQLKERLQGMQEKMATPEGKQQSFAEVNRSRRRATERDLEHFARRVTQTLGDIEYFRRAPLGWRDGVAVVWAGMRGAVTVAAAQTLPDATPQRSVLVLVGFTVATLSLLLQGGTISPLLRRIAPTLDQAAQSELAAEDDAERTKIMQLLRASAQQIPEPPRRTDRPRIEQFDESKRYRLAVLEAQREALLDARDNGTYDADVLAGELANLDAAQIAIEIRASTAGRP